MITEEKIQDIKKELTKGAPVGEVRARLLAEGYSKEDIDKCFAVKKMDMRSWYLIFAFSALLFTIWVWFHPNNLMFRGRSSVFLVLSIGLFTKYYLADKKMRDEKNK